MWNDSSQQIFFMIRAYGAYEHLRSAFWEMIAAASTSHAITPTNTNNKYRKRNTFSNISKPKNTTPTNFSRA
jgi:hypothetical protein